MNLQRFEQFKYHSGIIIESSRWLTAKIDEYLEEYDNLDMDDYEQCDQFLAELDHLYLKADWENRQSDKFAIEYGDIIDET